tara:strand:- start:1897 stop:2130 length:234 start_codon:yes stop_codon:yes gene_type:complete
MGKWFDIYIAPEGIAITLLQFFQVAVYYIKNDCMENNGDTYESKALDISFTIWKFSTHMHFVLAERNICRDVILAKS